MISPIELRIGNYYFNDGHLMELSISSFNILPFNQPEIEPIILTEEWLIRFGFTINKHDSASLSYDEVNSFIIEKWEAWHFTGGEGCKFSKEIIYVHQLQNIFFSLTGQELRQKNNGI